MAITLAESSIHGKLGADLNLPNEENIRIDALLFGEAQSRIVFTAKPRELNKLKSLVESFAVQLTKIGTVNSSGQFGVTIDNSSAQIKTNLDKLIHAFEDALPNKLA